MNVHPYCEVLTEFLNRIKRDNHAFSKETGIAPHVIDNVLNGSFENSVIKEIDAKIRARFPDFPKVDNEGHPLIGCTECSASESLATSRVISREQTDGTTRPYYEYRDTAMMSGSPIIPEWIRPLFYEPQPTPGSDAAIFNKGHLMTQVTLAIGKINFHWIENGEKQVRQMKTGEINYIPPYVPHCFTACDPGDNAHIIAMTFESPAARIRSESMKDTGLRKRARSFFNKVRRGDQDESKKCNTRHVSITSPASAIDKNAKLRTILDAPEIELTCFAGNLESVVEEQILQCDYRYTYAYNCGNTEIQIKIQDQNKVFTYKIDPKSSIQIAPFYEVVPISQPTKGDSCIFIGKVRGTIGIETIREISEFDERQKDMLFGQSSRWY